jgi:thiol:disulfide interchange protein DsbA
MRLIRTLLFFAACAVAGGALAADPKDGVEYRTLPDVQNTDAGKKIEVTEFFAYYCPHCHSFDPVLAGWVKRQGENIVFKRVHISRDPSVTPQQRLFATLDSLGLVEQYHAKVFKAMHEDGLRLNTDEAVFDWAGKAGLDRSKFIDTYRSFGVQAKMRRYDALMAAYRVDQWPLIAIDGRWITSPSYAGSALERGDEGQLQQAALKVMDYLVAKARAEKK